MTPVIHLSKPEIVRRGLALDAPLGLTWSCYVAEDRACGWCDHVRYACVLFRKQGRLIRLVMLDSDARPD